MEVKIKSPAKINLTLDILGKRPDAYHNVKMIMQTVSLYDEVVLTQNNSQKITIQCTNPAVPCDESNIVYKCAVLFFERLGRACDGLNIFIDKHIPTEAGLAGGSTDGAAVLRGLNIIYGEPFSTVELELLGAAVGADIPFCVRGGTALAEGIGTDLTDIKSMPSCYIVLVKPPVGISTGAAYRAADNRQTVPEISTDKMIEFLNRGDLKLIAENLSNDFENALAVPELIALKDEFMQCRGTLGACMTGSGSTVFGLFSDEESARLCAEHFMQKYEDVFVTEPCSLEI